MKELIGKTIDKIEGLEEGSKEVHILTQNGDHFIFYHEQDCCEEVRLCDFEADSNDFNGAEILSIEEMSNDNDPSWIKSESCTWTFYKIETTKGGIWMRWLGESNGSYSETVDFKRMSK